MKNLYSKFLLLQAGVLDIAILFTSNVQHQEMLFLASIASGLGCMLFFTFGE
jgi:hypothetical protein